MVGRRPWASWLAVPIALVMACGGGATPSQSSRVASTFEEWASDHCAAAQAIFLGYGNPDTATLSPRMRAFETAIEQGDPVRAAAEGAALRALFDHGREHARAGAGWAPGAPALGHLERFLAALSRMADAELGAMARGLGPAKEAGQAAFDAVATIEDWRGWLDGVRAAMTAAGVATLPACDGVPF